MADDSDSNNAESNRRSIADRLSFFENISKIQDTSQQPGRVSTDHDLEETPDNIPIATSRSDHSGEPLKDKDSDEKIGEDDSVFKTENDTIVQNKEDEDEKEDNMTKEKKWDKGNIELEKETHKVTLKFKYQNKQMMKAMMLMMHKQHLRNQKKQRANIVQEMIRKQLQSENKQVEFEVCDESKIIICMVDHMDAPSVKQMIQDMAVEDTIKLDEFSRNVPKKQIWVDTRSRVEKSNNGKLIIEVKDDKINITATKDIAHDVQKELRDVIVKNTILKETVSVPDVGKMKFIEKHCQDKFEDLEEDLNEESLQIRVLDNGIEISGTKLGLFKAQQLIGKLLSDIHHRQHDINKQSIGKFSLERGPMPTMPTVSMATPTVSSQKGQVKCQNGTVIYLVKGELAKQQGDVIVCSTSKDLNLKAGKAGANILHEGGQSIQDELKKNYPQGIQHGVVAVSNGGNLKCKQIYFGSLYDWHHEKGKPVKTITTFMNNCLNKAHQSSYTSILFAALGTGALGYPRDEAAQLMYQSVMDFDKANPNSTLKTIKFILYPKDSLTMDAFEQEEMSYINPAMKKAIKKGPVTSKYGMKIFIEKGSLGQQQADVLVCATPRDLSLNSAAASKSLLQDGGESIQIECSQNYPNGIKDGEIAVVGGGNLSCQKLYLTTIPSWDIEKSKQVQDMVVYKVISSCLEKASKAKYKSVAIPAMGTGKVNYPRKNIAKLLYECVLKFSEKNSKSSIQTVKFVVFPKDMETVRAFEKEEQNRLCPQIKYSSGSSSVVTPKCNITISIDTSTLSSAKVDVIVCSTAPGLDLNSGQSSKALLEAGGKTLQDECIDNYGDGIDCGEVAITLADFMKKCLTEADSAKMKTIAFSSLGTGGNGFPHNVAARTMYQAVFDFDKQHSSTSIKQVNFVIYSKDHKSIQAFQTEEKQHQPIQKSSGASTSLLSKILGFPSRRSSQNSDQTIHGDQDFAVGSMMLTFCVGDLLVQKVDAIVNSTNTDLDFSRGKYHTEILFFME
ncbi:hypothetical protein KUTeg_004896 [Tegillarca granosa]|uniref:Macro domain-containing protein n=1 Tax=Tegillarca granosa TaxID=220873 RepID=A0ABQ9FM14_TEGGR|nr:hypothetical protein KUTeg_004896 [Tegillarca granosa]